MLDVFDFYTADPDEKIKTAADAFTSSHSWTVDFENDTMTLLLCSVAHSDAKLNELEGQSTNVGGTGG